MTTSFKQVALLRFDVAPLQEQLAAHPELWGQQSGRKIGPHSQMTDIWARFRDMFEYRRLYGDDTSHIVDEHESVWQPCVSRIRAVKDIVFDLMREVEATRLGGVLLTKLPPSGEIKSHTDSGWHAGYYEKYYVAVHAPRGAKFCWEDGEINALDGEVYRFENNVPHWVVNNGTTDRVAMIVCLRRT